jgi:hypothetical protein
LVFGTRYAVEIAFATPDCKPGYTNKIEDLVKILRDLLKKHYPSEYDNIEIKLYFNDVFATKIYHPLREEIDKLNNDNDLFMRSLNLAKVAENKLPDSMKAVASVGKKSRSTAKGGSSGARKITADEFSEFKAFCANGSASSYCTSIRKIMKEMSMNDLIDLDNSIDAAIDYCTNQMNDPQKRADRKNYSNARSALRKYKEFMESRKVNP